MTPGEEAMREAARMESARVYGRVVREHRNGGHAQKTEPVDPPVHNPKVRRLRVAS